MPTLITVLPERHISEAFNVTSSDYKCFLSEQAKKHKTTRQRLHRSILQSIYNVHLRALDNLREMKKVGVVDKAALPIVAPHHKLITSAMSMDPNLLSHHADQARKNLAIMEKDKTDANDVIAASVLTRGNAGSNRILAIHQLLVESILLSHDSETIRKMVADKIGWETFLLFARESLTTGIHLTPQRSLREQVEKEASVGARRFSNAFAKMQVKYFEEDFAPLLNLLKRKR